MYLKYIINVYLALFVYSMQIDFLNKILNMLYLFLILIFSDKK